MHVEHFSPTTKATGAVAFSLADAVNEWFPDCATAQSKGSTKPWSPAIIRWMLPTTGLPIASPSTSSCTSMLGPEYEGPETHPESSHPVAPFVSFNLTPSTSPLQCLLSAQAAGGGGGGQAHFDGSGSPSHGVLRNQTTLLSPGQVAGCNCTSLR